MLPPRQVVLKIGLARGGNAASWAEELHRQWGRWQVSQHSSNSNHMRDAAAIHGPRGPQEFNHAGKRGAHAVVLSVF